MYINKKLLTAFAAFALALTAFAATWRSMNIVSSTITSTTTAATTPSTGAFTTLSSTGATFNTSVVNSGTGFKHVRTLSCTTAASASASCSTTVTWPGTAFADTNYTYGCNLDQTGGFTAYLNSDSGSKTTSTVSVRIINTPGNSTAANGTLNCWAWHD